MNTDDGLKVKPQAGSSKYASFNNNHAIQRKEMFKVKVLPS